MCGEVVGNLPFALYPKQGKNGKLLCVFPLVFTLYENIREK
jgi:hypothetical protein